LLHHIQPDHLGTPRKVIQTSNNTAIWNWPILGNAFGEAAPTGAITLNLRFPGQYFDAETGLNYNYFRDYEPGTGRYVESDPIGLRGGDATYAYVGANPLASYDPFGEAEHTTNKTETNRNRHENANARRQRDGGGERADDRRRPKPGKPDKWKGPWPPKPKPSGYISPDLVMFCGSVFAVASMVIMPGNIFDDCPNGCGCGSLCPDDDMFLNK